MTDQSASQPKQPDEPIGLSVSAAESVEAEVTVIEPRKGWRAVDFREMWRYRELLYFFIWRDLKARFKQTVLGAAWAVIQPIASMILFTFIFGKLAGLGPENVPYPLFVYAGILPWTFFSRAVTQSSNSLANQANLLSKIYFPRLFLPTSGVGVCLVDFALGFAVYLCLMGGYVVFGDANLPGASILLLPVLLLLTTMLASGVGYFLSSLTVSYRDVRTVLPFMTMTWMFVSPVVWPIQQTLAKIPEGYRWLLVLNPMYGIIGTFRSVLLNWPIRWWPLALSAGVAVVMFVFGIYYFRRVERRFADVA